MTTPAAPPFAAHNNILTPLPRTVGITVPKLLPITGTFAPAFAVYYTLLAVRVSNARVDCGAYIGDKPSSSSPPDATKSQNLLVATRAHGNFTENVPLALFLGAVVEMNGGNRKALTGALAGLLVARILHVELGLRGEKSMGKGRLVGHLGSLGFIVGMGGYAAWLVKGYWGF